MVNEIIKMKQEIKYGKCVMKLVSETLGVIRDFIIFFCILTLRVGKSPRNM